MIHGTKNLTLASLVFLAATAGVAGKANAGGVCREAIGAVSAKKLFDALSAARPNDGCTLENVGTEDSEMKVEWTKAGHVQEAIRIVPTSCVDPTAAQGKLSVIAPPSVESSCPAATGATKKIVEAGALGELVVLDRGVKRLRPLWIRLLAGGLALAGAIGVGVVVLRRRRRKRPVTEQA